MATSRAPLPKRVFPFYRQVRRGSLIIGIVGLAVTMGNMFVPKPESMQPSEAPPTAPNTAPAKPEQLNPQNPRTNQPKPTANNPFGSGGENSPFGGGSGNGNGPFG